MHLPNADRAVVDIAKLRDYLPGTTHPRGRRKGLVLSAFPGVPAADAAQLREAVLHLDATEMDSDQFGRKSVADFPPSHGGIVDVPLESGPHESCGVAETSRT